MYFKINSIKKDVPALLFSKETYGDSLTKNIRLVKSVNAISLSLGSEKKCCLCNCTEKDKGL